MNLCCEIIIITLHSCLVRRCHRNQHDASTSNAATDDKGQPLSIATAVNTLKRRSRKNCFPDKNNNNFFFSGYQFLVHRRFKVLIAVVILRGRPLSSMAALNVDASYSLRQHLLTRHTCTSSVMKTTISLQCSNAPPPTKNSETGKRETMKVSKVLSMCNVRGPLLHHYLRIDSRRILSTPIFGLFASRMRSEAQLPTAREIEDLPTVVGIAYGSTVNLSVFQNQPRI